MQQEQIPAETPETVVESTPPTKLQLFLDIHGIPREVVSWAVASVGGLLVAVVALTVLHGCRSMARRTEENACRDLFREETYSSSDIQKVIDNYPSAKTAPIMLLKLAHAQHAEGNFPAASASYERFLAKYPDHPLAHMAEMGKIVCMESNGDTERALQEYTSFATNRATSFLAEEAMFGHGRCLERLGRAEEAKQLYEDFLVAHTNSVWTPRVKSVLEAAKLDIRRKEGAL